MALMMGRIRRSLAVPLIFLTGAFVAVPVAVYPILEHAYEGHKDVLIQSVETQGRIAAAALAPSLAGDDPATFATSASSLASLAVTGAEVQLLFRPRNRTDPIGFYRVGAPAGQAGSVVDAAMRGDAAAACSAGQALTRRYGTGIAGHSETIASVMPIAGAAGCWALFFGYPVDQLFGIDQGKAFWQQVELERAAILYVGLAMLTLCVIVALQRNLKQFRQTASAIRRDAQHAPRFHAENHIAELDRFADELDRLVAALRRGTEQIRRRTEDDAHAFKTPIAILRQSLEPLGRGVSQGNEGAKRALAVLNQMVERMDHMVEHARRVEESVAELADPPRRRVDLTRLLRQMLRAYGALAEGRGIMLDAELTSNITVEGSEELITAAIEAVLDDVITSRPPGSHVAVQLRRVGSRAEIAVANNGPGISPAAGYRVFEPRFSIGRWMGGDRENEVVHVSGLWTARRNLQAMGGGVRVENSQDQGMLVYLDMPLLGAPPSGRQLRRAAVHELDWKG